MIKPEAESNEDMWVTAGEANGAGKSFDSTNLLFGDNLAMLYKQGAHKAVDQSMDAESYIPTDLNLSMFSDVEPSIFPEAKRPSATDTAETVENSSLEHDSDFKEQVFGMDVNTSLASDVPDFLWD